jgi:hypothetical protein
MIASLSVDMDPSTFDPEHRLRTLLADPPTHPWGALIPQILLWSFRRFCIQKITAGEPLKESLWEDQLELVHMYAPRGLETASMEWMTPDNISYVQTPLELYNRFFVDFVEVFDTIMSDDNVELQDKFSDFLDLKMGEMVVAWLSSMEDFAIFPLNPENDNEFTDDQFNRLIHNLVEFAKKTRAPSEPIVIQEEPPPLVEPVPPPPPVDPIQNLFPNNALHGPADDPSSMIWSYLYAPAMMCNIVPPQYTTEYVPSPAPPPRPPTPPPPAELEQPKTVSEAIAHRRMTLRKTGRRSVEPRVKTRRSHPIN